QRVGVLGGGLGYSVLNAKISGLKATEPGFALGAQYKLNENTQFGFRYRSEVKIEASGTIEGNLHASGGGGTVIPVTPAAGVAKTTFPQAATLGVQHKLNEMWLLLAEYGWTNYSKIDLIKLEGIIATTSTGTLANGANVQQYWMDQHNYRLAAQWGTEEAWPIRFGYGYTSQVTNTDYARAAFTPPGAAHTLTVGSGHEFAVSERPLRFDTGLEYTFATGDGNPNGAAAGSLSGDFRQGKYTTTSYALHLGVAYMF
ncbi:MAG: outer membrane protein transport protein, partial [Bdellovibrionota bacterium]